MPVNKIKKILFIHHDMGNSGASRSLSFLLDKLDPERYEAKVHCIFGGPVTRLFKKKQVEVFPRRGVYPFHGSTVTGMSLKLFLTNFFRFPQSLLNAYRIIKEIRPDLVHLNSSCLFVAAIASKLVSRKIKTVCHIREPLLRFSISANIMRLMNYLFVDQFIAIDTYSGSTMMTRGNINIVYNAVNLEEYNPGIMANTLRAELQLKADDIIFLYLARVSRSNGAMEFVQVANKLAVNYPEFHFVLAGFPYGTKDSYAKDVASLAAGNRNIHLMDFRNDIPALIAGADIMVVPFARPHFARSIVEASAMGKPAIGANIGGVNELILHNETGFLYNNEHEFLDYCRKLGGNKRLRDSMGMAAWNNAQRKFDNNISSQKVFAIYSELLVS